MKSETRAWEHVVASLSLRAEVETSVQDVLLD